MSKSRMTELWPASGGRAKGVTIVKALVYGNVSRFFGKKRKEDGHTHQWTMYVKPFHNEDMSTYVTVYHHLKLYHNEPNIMLGKKALVSEFYDEMIFQDPTAMMQQLLMMSRQLTLGPHKHETDFGDLEARTIERLGSARRKIGAEIAIMKEKLRASHEAVQKHKEEIRRLELQDGRE
uniref:YEATS domain-containing protein 4-like isoform X2 n=1 Tax=Myxine glutinosa TaxID=7769 RepID=UPI00358EF855